MNRIQKLAVPIIPPPELKSLLDKDKEAKRIYDTLAKSHQNAYCDWVGSAKQATTRIKRAEKTITMLHQKKSTSQG